MQTNYEKEFKQRWESEAGKSFMSWLQTHDQRLWMLHTEDLKTENYSVVWEIALDAFIDSQRLLIATQKQIEDRDNFILKILFTLADSDALRELGRQYTELKTKVDAAIAYCDKIHKSFVDGDEPRVAGVAKNVKDILTAMAGV
jgi:hypothetical protein